MDEFKKKVLPLQNIVIILIKSIVIDITGICYNSKIAKPGDIFVCLVGEHTDAHTWAKDAFWQCAAFPLPYNTANSAAKEALGL